jgi:hypothetical protein
MRHSRCARLRIVLTVIGAVVLVAGVLGACSRPFSGSDATPTPTVTPTPSPTPTPPPTPTPSPTPSPTPFVPPTIAVESGDSFQQCLNRNLSPELVVSLTLNQTDLTRNILRTCVQQVVPSELVFLLNPIIDDASQCALDASKNLSNTDLIALSGADSDQKQQIVDKVTNQIGSCLSDKYGLSIFS